MEKVVSDLLLDIASEKNGYSIGKPWRFTEFSLTAVVPISRVTDELRGYRLLSEVKDEVKVRDTGEINKVELLNETIHPVLVKAGEVLVGSTQSRAVAKSQIIMSGERVVVDCACVHSTQGIRGGQNMTPLSYSPTTIRRSIYEGYRHLDKLDDYQYSPRVQSSVWEGVNTFSRNMCASLGRTAQVLNMSVSEDLSDLAEGLTPAFTTPSEDLAGRLNESQEKYKDILKRVPSIEHQVGICLLTMSGLETLESFEHQDSWEKMREAILGSEADKISDVSDQNGLFDFREDKAKAIVCELLQKQYESKAVLQKEHTATYILDEERFMGEVVTLHGKPIHCAFMRKAS